MEQDNLGVMPVPAFGSEPDWPALLTRMPCLRPLAHTPQDPYYHAEGDVWTHTQMVVRSLLHSEDYLHSTAEERLVLFYAALLHDVAKPSTTVIDSETGKIGQPGHSRRGAVDARLLLWRMNVPWAAREAICRLIAVHQLPFFFLHRQESAMRLQWMLHKLSHELDVRLLAALAEADMRGRHYMHQADVLADIELFRELAREADCYGHPRAMVDAHTQVHYFRGAQVMPDYPMYPAQGPQVTVMSGLPASGKDTWVAQHRPDWPVVSFDDARAVLGLRHGQNEGMVAHHAIDRAKHFLRSGTAFVWNATHLSTTMRQKTLDLLYAYDAEVEIVYLEQPEAQLFRRNQKRDTSLNRAALERMLFKWEVPLPTEAHAVHYYPAPMGERG